MPSGGLYATYHLLRDPKATIDLEGTLPETNISAFLKLIPNDTLPKTNIFAPENG